MKPCKYTLFGIMQPMTRQNILKIVIPLTKVGATGLVIWLVTGSINFSSAFIHIAALDTVVMIEAGVIMLTGTAIGGYRLVTLLKLLGRSCSFAKGFEINLIGVFFTQVFVTFIGGDLFRVWELTKLEIEGRTAWAAIFLDRVMGLIGLVALAVLGLIPLLEIIDTPLMAWSSILAVAVGTAAIVTFFILGVLLPDRFRRHRYLGSVIELASAARFVWAAPRKSAPAFVASLATHLLNVLAIYVLAQGFGLDITYFECFLVVPIIMLLSMLPISFSGWGVREGMMIAAFALMGYSGEIALATSITFGLIMIAISLPGGLLWLRTRRVVRPASPTPPK